MTQDTLRAYLSATDEQRRDYRRRQLEALARADLLTSAERDEWREMQREEILRGVKL